MALFYIYLTSIVGQAIWLIIGLVLWIPILLLGISNFFYEVLRSSLSGNSISADTNIRLKNKIDIYPRGFRNFNLIIKLYESNGDNY
jgi:hypothetical protein